MASGRKLAWDYAGPALVLAGPPLVVVFLLVFGVFGWKELSVWLCANWANVAGAWGFVLSGYVLVVAVGVKQAADGMRLKLGTHSLLEDIEGARSKALDVGHFIGVGNWEVVRIRCEEVSNICETATGKWDGASGEDVSKKLVVVARIMRGLAERAATVGTNPLSPQDYPSIISAQLKATQHLSAVLGEARK